MIFNLLKTDVREQKMLSWASVGLLVFLSAFLWAPSRDGLQGIYVLSFFIPMISILLFRKPNFHEYGGWMTISALVYAGYSALSSLWGNPKDFGFFILQWCVLATWLCGSSFLFAKREIDAQKYLKWFVICGATIILLTIFYYYVFVFSKTSDFRLYGWNVFRNANEIGSMCGIIAILAFVLALQSISLKKAWFFYFFTAIAGVGLVASFSRGALLAFLTMALAALILIRPPIKIWFPPLLIVLLISVLLLVFTPLIIGFQGRSAEIGGRGIIWLEVFERCRENIFLGIGMAKDTTIIIPDVDVFNHAHNAWLDTLYRTGFIGLTLIFFHLDSVMQKFSRDTRVLPLYLWLGYGCICSIFDSRCFFWEIGAKWFLYWIPAGLIAANLTGILVRANEANLEKNNVIKD